MATLEQDVVDIDSPHFPSNSIIPQAVLDDLCSRFLINIPEEERKDVVRLCFQIETAHWFYVDFYRQEQPDLPPCGLKDFTSFIFQQFPFLNKTGEDINKIFENWKKYKYSVPVYGAIMLNQTLDKCVLVQPYMSRTSWGFPKGKVNKDESAFDCAVREVIEETGFNISDYAEPDLFLEHTVHDHQIRLYIVPGVPEKTVFHPQTRGEIKSIEWFFVDYLPSHKKDTVSRENLGLNPNVFFMVMPFVRGLRKWISGAQQKEHHSTLRETTPVESPGNIHLQKLLAKEEQRLEQEQKRAAVERRRKQQQEKFQLQHELNHPLRKQPSKFKTPKAKEDSPRHRASPVMKEQDEQLVYKILQRPTRESQAEDAVNPLERLLSGTLSYGPVGGHRLSSSPVGAVAPRAVVHPHSLPQDQGLSKEHSSPVWLASRVPPESIRSSSPSEHTWEDSEFQFSSSAFLNFQFDRKQLTAFLPTA